jgi:hypothetical protein
MTHLSNIVSENMDLKGRIQAVERKLQDIEKNRFRDEKDIRLELCLSHRLYYIEDVAQ